MKYIQKIAGFLGIAVVTFTMALYSTAPVSAASGSWGCLEFDAGICIDTNITSFSNTLLSLSAGVAAFVVMIQLALGAYKIMLSGGDPGKVKDGREQIMNALLGLALIILASTILYLVLRSLGYSVA
jgi:branched-subunit amino acid transport protein AzlD